MNQISLASLMMQLSMEKTKIVETNKVRHMILNSIRVYRSQFKEEYGEMILAYDSKHYWRRDFYPYYKKNRKKARDSDSNNWEQILPKEISSEIEKKFKLEMKELDYL